MPSLPKTTDELLQSDWKVYGPVYDDLAARELNPANVDAWLKEWSNVSQCVFELKERLYVAKTCHAADQKITEQFDHFMDSIYPEYLNAEQKLKEKLLASKLTPKGYDIQMRNMRAQADLYREENVPLLSQEQKMISEYEKIIGTQTVQWEGEERTITQLKPVYLDLDRGKREKAWRLSMERQLADREALNALWKKFLALRLKLAANAGKPDYRSYRWQFWLRFDYTPEDGKNFHKAIEQAVVPAASRIYERRRKKLGLDTLRPWDLDVDPLGRKPLQPFKDVSELISKTSNIFHHVDPQLGEYFDTLIHENLVDLENRKNKAPGAYCTGYTNIRKPFVFHNAVGLHDDVMTLIHESGHAFHVFEAGKLPYMEQLDYPMEFAEVASMSMELLAAPYLKEEVGGFYSPAEYTRARIEHLESNILFWPYMAVVDSFQHWVYENPQLAADPANCDAAWSDRYDRFMVGLDWSGYEDAKKTGWHRKLHIFEVPFYYIEYGLAQMAATMIWRNALKDQAGAVASYRKALALGNTATLPELYKTAGARLAFDAETLGRLVALCEAQINQLEAGG